MSRVSFTPTQGASVAEVVRDLSEAGQSVEIAKIQGSRAVRILGKNSRFDIGARGAVSEKPWR